MLCVQAKTVNSFWREIYTPALKFFQVVCPSKDCELTLDGVVGGLEALGGLLETAVDNHSHSCSQVPLNISLWLNYTVSCLLNEDCVSY